MTSDDIPWEQSPFVPPTSEAPAPRQRRKKAEDKPPRQPRAARKTQPAEAAPPAPARKPREPKAEPDTIKVSVKEYAEMRVTAFQREFVKLHKILAPIPAKARSQMLVELAKVLG